MSCCAACINASLSNQRSINCPNKQCGASNRFHSITPQAQELLNKLMIKCPECSVTVQYALYDSHQLKHHTCEYCSESLPSWPAIREHYYDKCHKFLVNCQNCEFRFSREDYHMHDCLEHYRYREFELIIYIASCLMQAWGLGIVKEFDETKCGIIGSSKDFITVLLPNAMFSFWIVCMWVNYSSIQKITRKPQDLHTDEKYMYLSLLACSALFIFINSMTMKYNHESLCGIEIKELGVGSDGILRKFPQHYVLTLLNLFAYAGSAICASGLATTYQRKKMSYVSRKLKGLI